MNSPIRKTPIYRLSIWIGFVICIICIYYLVSTQSSYFYRTGDTVNYWAVGKLMLSGGNPYSQAEVLKFQQAVGKLDISPPNALSMFLYPPWTIPVVLPLGLFDYPMTRVLWLLFTTLIIIICAKLIWNLYHGTNKRQIALYLITFSFVPTYNLLVSGHITALILLGLIGFLYFTHNDQNDPWNLFFAGVSASIALLKPQILYLFLFALLLWIIRNRFWLVFGGGAVSIFILTLISVLINPQVINQYWETFSNYPVGTWATPTIGFLLRFIFGLEIEWLQILPVGFGIVWLLIQWYQNYKTWDWLEQIPILLFVCVITSPYIWTYDMVILLIPIIALIAKISRFRFGWQSGAIILSFIILNIITFYFHRRQSDYWFVWFAPVLLLWYLIGNKIAKKNTPIPETAEQNLAQASPN